RTFTISNTDEAALNLTGLPKVVIGGIHAADFTVAAQPISPLLPFTGTSTFEIIFDPSALGVRYATVSIPNNDDNENPYNFSIQGAGLEPEIRVEQPLGTNLAVGGTRSLGQVPLGGAMDLVFTLRNTGASGSLLTGLEITLDGADASEFSIASSPSAPVLGPAGFTSFSVRFAPTSTGTKTAALHLASNDFDENPFHILLSGEGTGNVTATFNADSDVGSTLSGVNATGRVLDLTLNYAPIPGTNLTVVKSTGPAFIQGNFNNMANGSTVNLSYNGSTYPFIAWYYGGDGNDLVLLWPYTGLAAWGSNEDNQLGDNRTTQRLAPVAVDQTGVLAGKTIVQMVRGQYHTLALTSEGRVYAWGWNSSGQLGDNTAWTRSSPVAVNIVNGSSALYGKTVVSLAAGSSHSLALCSDGAVVTWGNNGYGQLGNNTPPQRNVPTAVNTTNGLSALYAKTVVSVAAGSSHSLALCSDGTVVAWGYNGSGQLGNNTTTQRYV
ncbi:MAG: choice-of-anchor D domain-containing protein, partial [Prosthecobacter sp.]